MGSDGVGLLGGKSAVLDRVVGSVAGGVHGVDSGDAAVLVDRDEPARVGGQSREARAVEAGERDDAVDGQGPLGPETDVPAALDIRVDAAMEADVRCLRATR